MKNNETADQLDFIDTDVENCNLPVHLIPNQAMIDRFIQNCKDQGLWENTTNRVT